MAEFQPSVPRGVDFGAIDRGRAQQDRARAQQQARHDKEHEFVTGLVAKGFKVKVLRADPKFNNITDSEWNILTEGERLKNEAKKQREQTEASLGQGQFEGLAGQGVTAESGTPAQKRAFGDRLAGLGALNDPNQLNQIGGALDTERQRRTDVASGQDLSQLGERAVTVDAEGRALAGKLDAEARKRATPKGQLDDITTQYYLDLAAGRPGDPNVKNMIDARAQLDPIRQWLAATLTGSGPVAVPPTPAERKRELTDNTTAFRASGETAGWKVVKPNKNSRAEVDADKAGKLIVQQDKTGDRQIWTRP